MMTQSMSPDSCSLDQLCINTIRTLSIDAVQKANSGHPGAPMGLAPAAYVLWTRMMRHHPKNPRWDNRDRFVLSGGHASMMLYSLLHLTGYDLSLDEIKHFRQWGSKTPGHPEYGHTPGVETTTGPLGQGIANAVGMAMAERAMAARFNRPGYDLVDHFTYVMCGDGDLMEGISAEAASLAGHLGLGKLILIYDDNQITIEGSTSITFTEDVAKRFEAYQWHVQKVADGNDTEAIEAALKAAKIQTDRPSIILLRTQIAFGSPNKQGTAAAHGAPLGEQEVCLTKKNLGCPSDALFCEPDLALEHFRRCVQTGHAAEAAWMKLFSAYTQKFPALARSYAQAMTGVLPEDWASAMPVFGPDAKPIATRSASGKVLNALAEKIPTIIGGSADLAPSNNTVIQSAHDFQKEAWDGRNIRFGVREHAMGAILSGMTLHGGLRPYGGTFLVFADYMRPAIRLAALMKLPVTYVFTHDSIAVGEDGPTHQPVEQVMSLRAIPGLTVIRPADANETAQAWRMALRSVDAPVALVLSRQNLPVLDRRRLAPAQDLEKGAYILSEAQGKLQAILIATGSEVHLALSAQQMLAKQGVAARVVSMPSWELFEKTPPEYRKQVLPPDVTCRVAVEAGLAMGWERYVGRRGAIVGMTSFGASAPGEIVLEKFGFTAENVVATTRTLLEA
jgi:transketolase